MTEPDEARRNVLAQGLPYETKGPLGGLRGAVQLLNHELEDKL